MGAGGGGYDMPPHHNASIGWFSHLARDHLHDHAQALRDHQDVTEDDSTIQLGVALHWLGEGSVSHCWPVHACVRACESVLPGE